MSGPFVLTVDNLLIISPAGLASPLLLLVGNVGMADGEREFRKYQRSSLFLSF